MRQSHDPSDRRRTVSRLANRGARVNAAREGTVEAATAKAPGGARDRERTATTGVLEGLAAHRDPAASAAPADGPHTERSDT